jgi:hypothetical protein
MFIGFSWEGDYQEKEERERERERERGGEVVERRGRRRQRKE